MTGLFLRIPRTQDGPGRPVDIDEMTDAELAQVEPVLATLEPWQLATWVTTLARHVRQLRKEADDGH